MPQPITLPAQLQTRLVELATAIPSTQWVLVGGCMVLCHADMAGIHAVRPTYDLDLVVLPTVSYRSIAAALGSIGYQPHESLDSAAPFHRFSRVADGVGFPVDVMVTETRQASFLNRRVIAAPGTRSIDAHTVEITIGDGSIRIPDLTYALAIKGAALRTDGFSIPKHATDGIELLACLTATDATPANISRSMRNNINTMLTSLKDPRRWEGVDETLRELAFRAAVKLRPDWMLNAGA